MKGQRSACVNSVTSQKDLGPKTDMMLQKEDEFNQLPSDNQILPEIPDVKVS